eukprot:TRINITY_DN18163_c0_g1_i3.p1 TRINITY_DN18163_c0_g1~~TRINITY_DN18163_c0_g1_i3.p1  ORF type:complete len:315 (-),score=62.21 TRINITY_DN18163_c0_g1_i3:349-1272(-)
MKAMKAMKVKAKKPVKKPSPKRRSTAPRKAAAVASSEAGPGGLCIAGESLIDMLPRQTAEGEACYRPCPGGAPFNALLAAARLGMPVTYLASLSSDMFGEQLHGILAKEGVNLDLVTRESLPTTLAFVSREPGQGEKYAFFKVLKTRRFDAVHVSLGAITLEDAQMKAAFDELLRIAGEQGALRTFDPNLRSNMISKGADSYRKLIEGFLRNVDIIKCSDDDIEFLYGHQRVQEIARHWLDMRQGPKLVVVTQGSKGSTTFYPWKSLGWHGGEIAIQPPGTRPSTIDATGASADVKDTARGWECGRG